MRHLPAVVPARSVLVEIMLVCMTFVAILAGPAGARELMDRIFAIVEEEPRFLSEVDNALAEVIYVA